MHPWYFFVWTFFFLEITFCGLSSQIRVGQDKLDNNGVNSVSGSNTFRHSRSRDISSISETNMKQENVTISDHANSSKNNNGSVKSTSVTDKGPNSKTKIDTAKLNIPLKTGIMIIKSKEPDKNFVNTSSSDQDSMEYSDGMTKGQNPTDFAGRQPKIDEKAVQRAFMVLGGLAVILLAYLGIKFAFLRKRKVNKRYGRIESEMDLLDEIEDEGDSEEEDDTLFDVNSTRRSQF